MASTLSILSRRESGVADRTDALIAQKKLDSLFDSEWMFDHHLITPLYESLRQLVVKNNKIKYIVMNKEWESNDIRSIVLLAREMSRKGVIPDYVTELVNEILDDDFMRK